MSRRPTGLLLGLLLGACAVGCASADSGDDGAGGASAPSTVATDAATSGLEIPVVEVVGEVRETPVPYFGSQRDDGGAVAPVEGFVPAGADATFCAAVAEINARPQPSDDYEEIVVAHAYFMVIEPVVPAELAEPFGIVLAWVGTIADAGSFEAVDERLDGESLLDAVDELTEFVDDRCLGR